MTLSQVVRDQLKASKAHAVLREADATALIKAALLTGGRDRARQLLVVAKNFRGKIAACEGKLANVELLLDSLADAQACRPHP